MKYLILLLAVTLALTGCGAAGPGDGTPPPNQLPLESVAAPSTPQSGGQAERETATLTILPGATLPEIGVLLEEMGLFSARSFMEAAESADLGDFPLLADRPPNPDRFFPLEGYLFPGVYEIDPNHPPLAVIRQILENTEAQIDGELRRLIAESGHTVEEVFIIASIIQKESLGNDQVKPLVSSVIHNRLNTGTMLQMCMTSFYVRDHIAPFYGGQAERFHDAYNTYIVPRLPAGPIGNPGLPAIRAALAPADTDYFFYIWDADDNFHFASQWEEHQANVQKYL